MSGRALTAALALSLSACGQPQVTDPDGPSRDSIAEPAPATAREVVIVGTIGQGHLASRDYSVAVLVDILRAVDADVALVELPPDRLSVALAEQRGGRAIREPRVSRFPEYAQALLPLTGELGLEVIGFDTWTEERARSRELAEQRLRIERPHEAERIDAALSDAERELEESGMSDNPAAIHGPRYDAVVSRAMTVYDELWGEALGDAGWGAGNRERLARLEAALETLAPRRRVLVMCGAWRKGALRHGLGRRSDVALIDLPALWPRRPAAVTRTARGR